MQNKLKSALESTFVRMTTFFMRQRWKEILIFLFFLLLSFGFWFLQSLQDYYERRVELPLRYKDVPSEWILSENNPQKISIAIKDRGTTLLYYSSKATFTPVEISVAKLPRSSDSSLFVSSRMLESAVSKQLISSTSVVSIDPREVEVVFDSLCYRTVPVVANVKVNTRPGYKISDEITISQEKVRLYGNAGMLEKINEVKTAPVTLDDVSKKREITAQLDLPPGVKSEIETVKITIPVEEFTEKVMQIPVICPDVPSDYVLRIFPSTVKATCNIPFSRYKELTAESLEIKIPFSDFKDNQPTGKVLVELTAKPSWVTNAAISPNELEFIIEHK
ncbi:MAG: hypothetical protein LBT42_06720 [Tannerella sp.]|nr:hypothetical protein [Tannerella sp.]